MAKVRTKAIISKPAPWWLMQGDEECPACGELYIYELEFRCPECDTISCLHCRRRHSDGRWMCVSCAESDKETP
ncbi:hypothetical protein JM946_14950 [Steroidobacter sp. S1-65]|uniref:Uncharacterized protein n=1 Tax=Steroidobacter gossypii TaxID=2805490 RepID=A0ABS1WYG3_9GAMM|nr:hypothetical protein [Steroidobacter gossypii]MBM0106029.1 hypothetical protein [Steroidobacter gossypii]